MLSDDYVECWFIGGPWNNQLTLLHRRYTDAGAIYRVALPDTKITIAANCTASPLDVDFRTVTYYRQVSLETCVPVFSCLEGARYGGYYTRFYLSSVTQK
jgi:hypothetical protein